MCIYTKVLSINGIIYMKALSELKTLFKKDVLLLLYVSLYIST